MKSEWVVLLRHNGLNIGFRGKDDVKIIEGNLFFTTLKIFDLSSLFAYLQVLLFAKIRLPFYT